MSNCSTSTNTHQASFWTILFGLWFFLTSIQKLSRSPSTSRLRTLTSAFTAVAPPPPATGRTGGVGRSSIPPIGWGGHGCEGRSPGSPAILDPSSLFIEIPRAGSTSAEWARFLLLAPSLSLAAAPARTAGLFLCGAARGWPEASMPSAAPPPSRSADAPLRLEG